MIASAAGRETKTIGLVRLHASVGGGGMGIYISDMDFAHDGRVAFGLAVKLHLSTDHHV